MSQANQSSPQPITETIQHALLQDLGEAKHLLKLLEEEQSAMQERDLKALSSIVNLKTDCIHRIEQQSSGRYQLLQSLQRSADEAGWKALISEQDDPSIHAIWHELLDVLSQCQHHNAVNGRMISRGQQTLHQLLNMIRGQVNPSNLYNHRGATESHQDVHTVTRA
jgi:flagellar biosynthesis/type III secretory pathway chaperone